MLEKVFIGGLFLGIELWIGVCLLNEERAFWAEGSVNDERQGN